MTEAYKAKAKAALYFTGAFSVALAIAAGVMSFIGLIFCDMCHTPSFLEGASYGACCLFQAAGIFLCACLFGPVECLAGLMCYRRQKYKAALVFSGLSLLGLFIGYLVFDHSPYLFHSDALPK